MSQQASIEPAEEPSEAPKVVANLSDAKKLKQDALELATLLYDMYKHEQLNARIVSGQSNDNMS